jgi:DNA polymerase-1
VLIATSFGSPTLSEALEPYSVNEDTAAVAPSAIAGLEGGTAVSLVALPGEGYVVAWQGGSTVISLDEIAARNVRWTWWSSREAATHLVRSGIRPRACWDLGAIGALLYGSRRNDPAAVWAAAHGLAEPETKRAGLSLFDIAGAGPLDEDGQLSNEWLAGGWAENLDTARRWAELALEVQQLQHEALRQGGPIRTLAAHAESAAALLCVELENDGLPIDRATANELLRAIIGDRPATSDAESAQTRGRESAVLQHFPGGEGVDLRSTEQVKALLARIGLDLPDTRSWRLEPHAATNKAVAALVAWRKADRVATTNGWRWLDTNVGADGRLRGRWLVADGGAGRMTAGAGLHNMPAELRPAVRAKPGHVFVGADLGQVEPRVLAAVSGDPELTEAAQADDMYAPVAAQLGCDRPTAKVAVLAAMYGQTSGSAGAALRDMDRAYPRAMAFLRAAESVGQQGGELRTYGGRLIRFGEQSGVQRVGVDASAIAAKGRYARNAVIQGAAAELFKAWSATVRAGLAGTGGQIVLCLHDELLLHVPEANADAAADLLTHALAATTRWWAGNSTIRFIASVGTGPSWTDVH